MGFSRQEYWSGLSFPSPGDLPDLGIKPRSLTLEADSLSLSHQGSPLSDWIINYLHANDEKSRPRGSLLSYLLRFTHVCLTPKLRRLSRAWHMRGNRHLNIELKGRLMLRFKCRHFHSLQDPKSLLMFAPPHTWWDLNLCDLNQSEINMLFLWLSTSSLLFSSSPPFSFSFLHSFLSSFPPSFFPPSPHPFLLSDPTQIWPLFCSKTIASRSLHPWFSRSTNLRTSSF